MTLSYFILLRHIVYKYQNFPSRKILYYIGKKLVTIARFILGETFIVSKFSWPFFRKVNDSESTESTVDSTNDEALFRPTIGVALGSGSARGWAHIGIMRALEEGGIEPDFICGTSIVPLLVVAT